MNKYIQPDFSKCAIITIDMQNDFALAGAIAEVQGTKEIIPRIKNMLDVCRAIQIPILHVIRLYHEDGSNADICRKLFIESGIKMVIPGSKGADLVAPIKAANAHNLNYHQLLNGSIQEIAKNEWAFYKSRWGAFYATKLEDFLKNKNIDTLIFTGCNFPNCPRTSIYEASERDFKIVMVEDAISGVYDKGIEEVRNIGALVLSSHQLIQHVRSLD